MGDVGTCATLLLWRAQPEAGGFGRFRSGRSATILRSVAAKTLHARILDLVGEGRRVLELDELRVGLLGAIRTVVPCDYASLNQVGQDPDQNWSIVEPPMPIESFEVFYRLAHQNPLAEKASADARRAAVIAFQISSPQNSSTRPICTVSSTPRSGLEYQISFALPSYGEEILAIALSRRETDFTDQERELLAVARPHLIQIYRNALQHSGCHESAGSAVGSVR